jgi:hypothetical protein
MVSGQDAEHHQYGCIERETPMKRKRNHEQATERFLHHIEKEMPTENIYFLLVFPFNIVLIVLRILWFVTLSIESNQFRDIVSMGTTYMLLRVVEGAC